MPKVLLLTANTKTYLAGLAKRSQHHQVIWTKRNSKAGNIFYEVLHSNVGCCATGTQNISATAVTPELALPDLKMTRGACQVSRLMGNERFCHVRQGNTKAQNTSKIIVKSVGDKQIGWLIFFLIFLPSPLYRILNACSTFFKVYQSWESELSPCWCCCAQRFFCFHVITIRFLENSLTIFSNSNCFMWFSFRIGMKFYEP